MSTIQTPPNQLRINDPYQQRLFDFNTSDSRLYLARVSNQLLKTFGNDIVLNGFGFSNLNFSANLISTTIAAGLAIEDQTLIEISDIVNLDIDVTSYEDSGSLVVYLEYQWLQTVTENPVRMKLSYVSSDGTEINPDGWTHNRDRLVLAIYEFAKDPSNNVTSVNEITDTIKRVFIDGQWYYKFGYENGMNTTTALDTYFEYSGLTGAGGQPEIIQQATAPSDLSVYWVDSSTTPATIKYHDGISWEALQAAGSGGGLTEIYRGTTAPIDLSVYWVDTSTTPASWKYHDGSTWTSLQTTSNTSISGYSEPVITPTHQFVFDGNDDIVMTII